MSGRAKVTRFSVSLPPGLVDELDEAWRTMKYENRSKAIHDAVSSFITEFKWMKEESGQITGTINVLYYTDKPGLIEEIVEIQHHHRDAISSSLHVHLEENKCLEIIAVRGTVKEVKGLTQALLTRKGVKQVRVAAMAP